MTEPDEVRPGGPDTPAADPAPPTTGPGPEARSDDAVARPPATSDVTAAIPTPAPVAPPPPVTPPPVLAAEVPAPAPAPAPAATASGPAYAGAATDDLDLDDYEDEFDDLGPRRWVGVTTTLGAGMIGVVALQVLLAIVEGLTLDQGERFAIADDFFHRIGYPFGSLGSTAVFFLLLGVVLLVLPAIVGEEVTDRQYAIAGAALRTAVALGVIIAIGSILAVRGSLHANSAAADPVPGYVQVQFTNFLLATLAASALAIYAAVSALGVRNED